MKLSFERKRANCQAQKEGKKRNGQRLGMLLRDRHATFAMASQHLYMRAGMGSGGRSMLILPLLDEIVPAAADDLWFARWCCACCSA